MMDEFAEREWAKVRFTEYLLGRLDPEDTERFTMAVAVYSGLIDDLEDAEAELIRRYLDNGLSGEERSRFEAQYVHTGNLDRRAKLGVERALRSSQAGQAVRAMPRERPRLRLVSSVAAAALIAAVVFGVLYYLKSRELVEVLTRLHAPQTPLTPPNETPREQPAGSSSPEGLLLSARIAGTGIVTASDPPPRLTWTPVPDYRARYRFRIYAGGREISSEPLAPKNNAIEYAVPNPPALPWDIFVLGENGRTFAHYIVRKP